MFAATVSVHLAKRIAHADVDNLPHHLRHCEIRQVLHVTA